MRIGVWLISVVSQTPEGHIWVGGPPGLGAPGVSHPRTPLPAPAIIRVPARSGFLWEEWSWLHHLAPIAPFSELPLTLSPSPPLLSLRTSAYVLSTQKQ